MGLKEKVSNIEYGVFCFFYPIFHPSTIPSFHVISKNPLVKEAI
jgi:hypothetical protein